MGSFVEFAPSLFVFRKVFPDVSVFLSLLHEFLQSFHSCSADFLSVSLVVLQLFFSCSSFLLFFFSSSVVPVLFSVAPLSIFCQFFQGELTPIA